ncbi:hypothetical protein ACFLX1_02545, partial [Chloroflexota bacterium]
HDLEILADLSEGFSGSDIQDVCRRLNRRWITMQLAPTLKDAFQILQNIGIGEGEERRFLSAFKTEDPDMIVSVLRQRNKKLYSHAVLARLLGVSKATAYRRTVKGGKQDDH